MVFSLPPLLPEKNPTRLLSGDQNGENASSEPANCCAVSESSDRTHNIRWRSGPEPAKASRRPSGDSAISRDGAASSTITPSGGSNVDRKVGVSTGLLR